ncbi:MAG: FtsW/RodA/SpoVE family cell cycle protein [Algisphaera sp.]
MSEFAKQFKTLLKPGFAWLVLPAGLALTAIGVMAIDTVAPRSGNIQKTVNLPIALLCMLLTMVPHPRTMGRASFLLFGVSLGLLVFLLVPFVPRSIVPVINGARSWIDTPGMNFQPSEMTKVFFVLSLAWYFRFRKSHRSLLGLVFPFVLMVVPVMLIMMQPDLGTALVFAPALFAVLVAAGAKLRHLFSLLGLGTLLVVANIGIILYAPPHMQVLKDHQQRRVRSMIKLASGDTSDIQADAYQQYKAMTLSGAGGVWGYGAEQSREVFENFHLPEAHNDMIFAVIVNRWGMVGGVVTVGLYGVMVVGFLGVSASTRDPLGRLSCVGFGAMILTQVVVNVGMTLGILPITGITLPLISYGGSSLLFTFIMLGLVLNFASRGRAMMARDSFEF